jgi:hypothetical protein
MSRIRNTESKEKNVSVEDFSACRKEWPGKLKDQHEKMNFFKGKFLFHSFNSSFFLLGSPFYNCCLLKNTGSTGRYRSEIKMQQRMRKLFQDKIYKYCTLTPQVS